MKSNMGKDNILILRPICHYNFVSHDWSLPYILTSMEEFRAPNKPYQRKGRSNPVPVSHQNQKHYNYYITNKTSLLSISDFLACLNVNEINCFSLPFHFSCLPFHSDSAGQFPPSCPYHFCSQYCLMVEQRDFLSQLEGDSDSKHKKIKCKWGKSIRRKLMKNTQGNLDLHPDVRPRQ